MKWMKSNAFEPTGINGISVGFSSSSVLPNGNYIFGINSGKFDPPRESQFGDWYNSPNSKFYTLMDISFNKETILTLNEIGNVPWGTYAETSGSLWFKGVSIEQESIWPSGGDWFVGRKVHLTNNNKHLKDVETDGLSRFIVDFIVKNRPEKRCSLQAHYDGDNKYFDRCDSNIIDYEIVRHKTTLTVNIDSLRLNPLNRNSSTSHGLETDQEFRIKGSLIDTDFDGGIKSKRIDIESNLPFPITPIATQNDGSFLISNLKTSSTPGSYYVKALFEGDDLYEKTKSDTIELQTAPKIKKVAVNIMEGEHIPKFLMKYDVFISHASEDKEDIARPLAERLKKMNVKVWYDEFTLKIGDSLNGINRQRNNRFTLWGSNSQ